VKWSRDKHHLFPVEFRAVVLQLVRGHYSPASVLSTMPMDVLELVIAHLARNRYSCITAPAPPAAGKATGKQKATRHSSGSAPKRRAVAAAAGTE
jgi:hypothetical protein